MDKTQYELETLAGRKTGDPLATISYYGLDDQFASKLVVGSILTENEHEASQIKRWFSIGLDLRLATSIYREILNLSGPSARAAS